MTQNAESQELLTYMDQDGIHLRWQGYDRGLYEGYQVYRKDIQSNDWQLLSDELITVKTSEEDILETLSYQAGLYYAMFSREKVEGDISVGDIISLRNKDQEHPIFGVLCLINYKFGEVLGEIYLDKSAIIGKQYEYRIDVVVNGVGSAHSQSSLLDPYGFESMPSVNALEAKVDNEQVSLSWDKHVEEMKLGDVVSYNIYQSDSEDGSFEKINNYNQLSVNVSANGKKTDDGKDGYLDKYLENGKEYYYRVKAMNAFGIEGPSSVTIKAIPEDQSTPLPPTELNSRQLGEQVQLSWECEDENVSAFEVFISKEKEGNYKSVHQTQRFKNGKNIWLLTDYLSGDESFVYIVSENRAGNKSEASSILRIYYLDRKAPSAPKGVQAIAKEGGEIVITWNKNTEKDILGYDVERASDNAFKTRFLLNSKTLSETAYTDELPETSQTTYGYVVYAIDLSENRSEASEIVKARLPDHVPPQVPFFNSLEDDGNTVVLGWTKSIDEDFHHFEIERSLFKEANYEKIGESTENWFENSVEEDGRYYYRVRSVDESGNASEPSAVLSFNYEAKKTPDTPASGEVKKEGRNLKITWSEVTHKGVKGYLVTRINLSNGQKLDVADLRANTPEYLDLYSDISVEYEYHIRTYDEKWRESRPLVLKYVPENE